MHHAGPYFGSPCPALTWSSRILFVRLSCLESRTKTPHQMLLINRLTKVTNDPVVQGAGAFPVVGISGNENCRNSVPCLKKVFIKFDAGHRRHMDVSDQTGRFYEAGGSEEIRGR